MNEGQLQKDNTQAKAAEKKKKSEIITGDDLFRRSSQFRLWSFTVEQLDELCQKTHEAGRSAAIDRFNKAHEAQRQNNPKLFEDHEKDLSAESLLKLLTFEEEKKYLSFQIENIIKIASSFRMPTQVKATAVSFFKRFYLNNSVMQYRPKNVLLACVFLAAKSENYFISIESFCKALPKIEPSDVLDLEFDVLSSLKFTLFVHSPFRPLYGFFLDFQAVLLHEDAENYDLSVDSIGGVYEKARTWLSEKYLLSRAEFLFSPPQIALAAFYDVNSDLTERYLKSKFSWAAKNTSSVLNNEVSDMSKDNLKDKSDQYQTLKEVLAKCIEIVKDIPKTTREETEQSDRKCYFCLNPDRVISKKVKNLLSSSSNSQ